jgi:thioredoxin reductase
VSDDIQVAVLGAGPAGLAAGLWLKNLGLEPLVLECGETPGGLLALNFLANNWIPGQPGVTGQELGRRFYDHACQSGVSIRLGVQPRTLCPTADGATLCLDDGGGVRCAALVIATGVRYRGAEILDLGEGENALDQAVARRIFCGPFAFADLAAQAGKHVLIVGGGDNAYENAGLLLRARARVTLVSRAQRRARRQIWEAVAGQPACAIHEHSKVLGLTATPEGLNVRLGGTGNTGNMGAEHTLQVDRIHILAGYAPNTAFLAACLPAHYQAKLQFDPDAYLRVDAWGRTGVPGLYAAGDVCNPDFPGVVSALAQGAKTAKAIEKDLAGRVTLFS